MVLYSEMRSRRFFVKIKSFEVRVIDHDRKTPFKYQHWTDLSGKGSEFLKHVVVRGSM